MSEEIKNGDLPAYPTPYCDFAPNGDREFYCDNNGMTKREVIAMHSIHCVLDKFNPFECGDFDSSDYETVAKHAVGIADALLRELGEKK